MGAVRHRCGLALIAVVLPFGPAAATTSTTTFLLTMAVQATCTVSASPLAFGSYSGVQIDSTATITATCTNTTPYYINCDGGLNYGAGFYPRMHGSDGTLINYYAYRDAARTQNWGNTYNADGVSATGSGTPQNFTLYGRVAGGQYGTPGSYTDTLTITVTY